jgi:hypothetical protein
MNRPIQPDIHPDADSLNAFAERVLPDAERTRILEHMAGCARCRDIVYLAQQMADVEGEPSPAAEPKAGPRPGWLSPLFTGWRIAWIPAAALAAVGGILIWVHPRSERATIDMAKVSVPPAPAASIPPPLPATAHSVPSQPPLESAARRSEASSRPAAAASHEESVTASPKVTMQADQSALQELRAGNSPVPMAPAAQPRPAMSAPAQVVSEPPLAKTQWQQPQPPEPTPMTESRAMSAKSVQAPAPSNMVALHGTVMTPAADGSSQVAAEAPSPLAGVPPSIDGLAVLRVTRRLKLPSGLNAVSSAGTMGRLLALDPAGAVFLSLDAGKHWDPVQPQWTGRAIELHAQQRAVDQAAPSGNTGGPVPSTPAEPALDERSAAPLPPASVAIQPATVSATAAVPAMLFRLVNDHHQTWISTDGKTWHEQPQ